jgi:hypothetical protein
MSHHQAAFKALWEKLVAEGMDANKAAAEALKRFRAQQQPSEEQTVSNLSSSFSAAAAPPNSTTNTSDVTPSAPASSTSTIPTSAAVPTAMVSTATATAMASVTTSPTSSTEENVKSVISVTSAKTNNNGGTKSEKRPAPEDSVQPPPSKTQKDNDSSRVMSLSLKTVQTIYQQSQEESSPTLMIRMAGTYFADELKLNNSFVAPSVDLSASTEVATASNPGIDFEGLAQAYGMMQSNSGIANSLINANGRMLDSLKSRVIANPSLLSTPTSLRFVFMVLENPLLLEPSNMHVTRKLCRVISNLSTASREYLVSWFITVGPDRCRNYVKKMHQYITLSIYMEDGTPSIMDVIIALGLIHEASLHHHEKLVTGSSVMNYKEFFNDAINDVANLEDDFEKWYRDRKKNGSNRRRLRSGSSSSSSSSSSSASRSNTSSTPSSSLSSSSSSTTTATATAAAAADGTTTTTMTTTTTDSNDTSSSSTTGESKIDPATLWQTPTRITNPNSSFCACNYVLDTASKAKMLRYDAMIEQRHVVMDVARRQGGYMTQNDVYLILDVDRSNLISSTLNGIGHLSRTALRKPLKVRFKGEKGVDEGGVKKEFFQVMLRNLFDPEYDLVYSMFSYIESTRLFYFSPDTLEPPVQFELVGIILGLAIFNSVILDVQFPKVIFHRLMGASVELSHLQDLDPAMYDGLSQLLSCENAEDTCLTFETTRTTLFGETLTEELITGGSDIDVTNENREEYVQLYLQHRLVNSVSQSFDAFKRGFYKVCECQVLEWFHANELELLICGSNTLDFESLKDGCRYDGYEAEDRVICDFWDVVSELTTEQQAQLLAFATGSARAPINGLKELRMTITKAVESEQLPTSHTCFNQLILPAYESKKVLREKILIAITHATGFGLL